MRILSLAVVLILILMPQVLAAQAGDTRTITLAGTITEKQSGEVVIGASVALYRDTLIAGQKPERGAVSNRYGYYAVRGLRQGKYIAVASYVGYAKYVTTVQVGIQDTALKIDIAMEPAVAQGKEVTITADREGNALQRIGTITLSPDFIKEMPSLGGEVDVFRVLQLLPGVKSASEISSGLYVRGGSPDQNLTLLDGVIVYNPAHLGGFLSSFHADALRDIRLIKGAFPAEYGGRMSSVLDLTMKEGNKEKLKGSGHISMIASGLTLDGPIDSTTTFMVSGRRFYLDLLLALAPTGEEEVPTYYFYDLNLKVNKKLGERDHLFLSGYFGRDVLGAAPDDNESIDISWGNSTANMRWTHIWAPELFSSTSLIYTDFRFGVDLASSTGDNSSTRFATSSNIRDLTARSEFQWSASDAHSVKFGLDLTHHSFDAYVSTNTDRDIPTFADTGTINAIDGALYLQDEWTITEAWRANIGARLYWFQQGNYVRAEPRFSTSYDVTDNSSITASIALAHQFLHLIVRNDIALPTDVWFPSTATIEPARCWQGVLGYQTTLFDGSYRFTAETYYKSMANLYEYRDDAEFTLGIPLESQFTKGTGEAYGLELFLQRQVGSFTGWIGYTLAWTFRTFPDLNEGRTFYPRYDRRHDVSVALQYRLGESWRFGATFSYATGAAYTVASGQYYTGGGLSGGLSGNTEDLYTERNGWRIPSFHKLDLHFLHEFTMYGLPWELSLNIYNAYNRANPFAVYTGYQYDQSGESKRVLKQITLFPIIPTLGLRVSF